MGEIVAEVIDARCLSAPLADSIIKRHHQHVRGVEYIARDPEGLSQSQRVGGHGEAERAHQ